MALIDFITNFPDEESCKLKFKEYREYIGYIIVCSHCGCSEHYWKRAKESYECKACGYRQSLRSNTVMHKSKLPYMANNFYIPFHCLAYRIHLWYRTKIL